MSNKNIIANFKKIENQIIAVFLKNMVQHLYLMKDDIHFYYIY
jgi:transcriptional regulator of NAD metabolism